jgi:hypothetical protein
VDPPGRLAPPFHLIIHPVERQPNHAVARMTFRFHPQENFNFSDV